MANWKDCMNPHVFLHSVFGAGVGLLIAGLLPGFAMSTGMLLGVILVLAAFLGEFMYK